MFFMRALKIVIWVYCVVLENSVLGKNQIDVSMEVTIQTPNSTLAYRIESLPDSFASLGEAPHWDVYTQNLYYVDLEAGKLMRYDFNQNKVYSCKIYGEDLASFVIPIEGMKNKFAVGIWRKLKIVSWDGIAKTCFVDQSLFEVQTEETFKGNRFNDGKCDPQGRLFAGTMKYIGDPFLERLGELYKYENGTVEVVKSDVGISNGLAWNEAENKFYFADTADFDIKKFDYNFINGTVSQPKVILNLLDISPRDLTQPDGMTIDTEGNIYVATFNGHTVYKVNPRTERILFEIKFPCKQITSVAWGGPNLDILFVTTAAKFGEPAPSGTTFKVTGLEAKGFPMTKMRV